MGYECPVCEAPQADRRHLADHLALTAMTRGGDHEAFLDEHVPDWEERGPAELGAELADHAVEREYPQVFEDTTDGRAHDHRHGSGADHGSGPPEPRDARPEADAAGRLEGEIARAGRRGPAPPESETRAAVREAREMTAEMLGGRETADEGAGRGETDRDDPDEASDPGATETADRETGGEGDDPRTADGSTDGEADDEASNGGDR